jgi:hypothetical protein
VDLFVDTVLSSGVGDVLADRGTVGKDFYVLPRAELETEGEHVGVRTDTWITEQVPRAAEPLATLQYGDGLVGKLCRHMTGSTDTGQAGADDQDVEMLCGHGLSLALLACFFAGRSIQTGRGRLGTY